MTARALLALHERLCRARAYPSSAEELAATRRLLAGFSARRDLRRSAEALADSGIAGTPIRYRFFWPMARWLARRYPALLRIDWSDPEFEELWQKGLSERDAAKRGAIYARMTEIMENTGCYVWITYPSLFYIHRDNLAPALDPGGEMMVEDFQKA